MTTYLVLIAVALAIVAFRYLSWKKATLANTTVQDGDSILITTPRGKFSCRIIGYDSPEWNQAYGREATRQLKTLLAKGYSYRVTGTDAYDRTLIKVRNAKGSVARQMVACGAAHNCSSWKLQEFVARITRRGLWAGSDILMPVTFRSFNQ
jgi:endonuclease YncB( thermonuclease family)